MYREWNVFIRLRQALVHIQTTNALGRRPRPYSTYSQPFRPGREIEASVCELVCTIYKSPLQQLEHSAQENANLKHSVSPGAHHCSGPQPNGRFGANYEWRRLHSTQSRKFEAKHTCVIHGLARYSCCFRSKRVHRCVGVDHEEHLEAVDLTSYVGTIPTWLASYFLV